LQPPRVPPRWKAEFLTSLAGPLVNFLIGVATLPYLLTVGETNVFHPFVAPVNSVSVTTALAMLFWLNWMLLLVNLLPAYPLDGARALRALASRTLEPKAAFWLTARVAVLCALSLLVAAVAVAYWMEPRAAGFSLAILAVMLLFSARQEAARMHDADGEERPFGYDFSAGYTSLNRSFEHEAQRPGMVRRWLELRKQRRRERRVQEELELERRLDEILSRLHEGGMDAISAEDRAILKRASVRYRSRVRPD
jgi:hypothetical protein